MDEEKYDRHNQPKDGDHVEQAGCEIAEHGAGEYGSKWGLVDRRDRKRQNLTTD